MALLGTVAPGAKPARAGVKRIVRHVLANIRFVEVTPERALVCSYFTVFTEIGLDHYGRYRDIFVPVDDDQWLIEHRLRVDRLARPGLHHGPHLTDLACGFRANARRSALKSLLGGAGGPQAMTSGGGGGGRSCRWGGGAARRRTTTERGHLKSARRSRQKAISSSAERRRGPTAGSAGCTTARTASPISGSGTPITATSATAGCSDQDVLDLAGVDVDPARDDHVATRGR